MLNNYVKSNVQCLHSVRRQLPKAPQEKNRSRTATVKMAAVAAIMSANMSKTFEMELLVVEEVQTSIER